MASRALLKPLLATSDMKPPRPTATPRAPLDLLALAPPPSPPPPRAPDDPEPPTPRLLPPPPQEALEVDPKPPTGEVASCPTNDDKSFLAFSSDAAPSAPAPVTWALVPDQFGEP